MTLWAAREKVGAEKKAAAAGLLKVVKAWGAKIKERTARTETTLNRLTKPTALAFTPSLCTVPCALYSGLHRSILTIQKGPGDQPDASVWCESLLSL